MGNGPADCGDLGRHWAGGGPPTKPMAPPRGAPKLLLVVGFATVVFLVQLMWTQNELGALRSLRSASPPPPAGGGAAALSAAAGAMPSPAIILFCYNRPHYLRQTLASLAGLAGLSRYTLYVSQVWTQDAAEVDHRHPACVLILSDDSDWAGARALS